MASAAPGVDSRAMAIRPGMGTGWETAVDEPRREIRLRLKLLGLPLPVRKRIPFSQVKRVGVESRQSWWSRAGVLQGGWAGAIFFGGWARTPVFGAESDEARTEMLARGSRYDLIATRKSGQVVKLVTLKRSDDAYAVAAELGRRVGLPPASPGPQHS